MARRPPPALVRELHEELGVWVEVPPWEVPVAALYLPGGGEAPAVALEIWHITGWDGEIRNVAPWEHEELAFCTADDLASLRLAHPALARIITSCLSAESA